MRNMDTTHRELYHPWRAIDRLHREADTVWRLLSPPSPEAGNLAEWLPAVDIEEEEERFVIRADVPGVDAGDLDIRMAEGVLTVQGTREARSEEHRDGLRRAERIRGRFKRSFSLPDNSDPNEIAADYRNGVLEITIPKQARAKPRRIEVESS